MKFLLDTHTFLWFIEDSSQLKPEMRSRLEEDDSDVYVSIVSLWEIAIKVSLGKFNLKTTEPFEVFIQSQLEENDIVLLPVTVRHLGVISALPLHHRDPFDRMLIAQAQVEGLTLVSRDEALDAYGITRLW